MRSIANLAPEETIAAFCRRRHIRKLAFLGSILRDDFSADRDIDVLVEWETVTEDLPPLVAQLEKYLASRE
jgi:predicted nucleotidyltransferase